VWNPFFTRKYFYSNWEINMSFVQELRTFDRSLESCGDILGEGRLFLAPLPRCLTTPQEYTLEVDGAVDVDDEEIDLQVSAPATPEDEEVYLQAGRLLYFGATTVEVAQDAVLLVGGPAVTVSILPAEATIADGSTTDIINVLEVVGISNMPLDFASQTENNKKLRDGIQGSIIKTSITPAINAELFFRFDDDGFWQRGFLYDGGVSNSRVYAISLRGNERHGIYGPVEVQSVSFQSQVEQLQKVTAQLSYVPTWYEHRVFDYLSAGERTAVNNIRELVGLPALV
jgi:hypothetical protein